MSYCIEDPDLGHIVIHVNQRAKRVIARKRDGLVHLTVPSYSTETDIRNALHQIKPKLPSLASTTKKVIDENFTLHAFSFDVVVVRNNLSKIYLSLKDRILQISVPQTIDLYRDEIQQQLRSLIESGLRHEAKRIFPSYVKKLADLHGFHFSEVKINKSTSRWGSCSSKKSINLSYFCLLLPPHLLDLIVLHELCHTREMNHGDRFWAQLDSVTGNRAKVLTQELKDFSTAF
jgi:predicted metal-dependent hydrolase